MGIPIGADDSHACLSYLHRNKRRRRNDVQPTATLTRRIGWIAVTAGVLTAVSVGAELAYHVERDTAVVDRPVFAVYLALYGLGMAALAATLVGLRRLHYAAAPGLGRAGRLGLWLAFSGATLNVLFAVVHGGIGTTTGETPDAFVLFGIGMLLLIIGQLLVALGFRRAGLLERAWLFPLAGAGGLILAIVAVADPFHDIGLFVFFGSWVALGVTLISRAAGESKGFKMAAADA